MPFTLAHPAAVLPLGRWRLVPSALVAGALAPDVVFYLPPWAQALVPGTPLTHSARGLVTVDLVIGLVLVVLWRVLLRRPWLGLLPEPWRSAALQESAGPVVARSSPLRAAGSVAIVALGVVIGTATHLLLDLLTHDPGVTRGPAPAWLDVAVAGIPLYDALQWLLSAIGLAVLAWWCWRWARRQGTGRPGWQEGRQGLVVLAIAGVAAAVGGAIGVATSAAAASPAGAVTALLVGAVGWAAVVLGGYALAWWGLRIRGGAGPAGSPAGRPAGQEAAPPVVPGFSRPRRPGVPATSPGGPRRSRTRG